jgi:hypothetical protein
MLLTNWPLPSIEKRAQRGTLIGKGPTSFLSPKFSLPFTLAPLRLLAQNVRKFLDEDKQLPGQNAFEDKGQIKKRKRMKNLAIPKC